MRNVPQPVQNGVLAVQTNGEASLPPSYERQSRLLNPPKYSTEIPDIPPATYGSRLNGASSSNVASNYDDSDRDLEFESNGVLKFEVRPAKMGFYRQTQEDEESYYHITLGKPRGRVLIININSFDNNIYSTRVGSETDVTNLDKLFTQLNYTVNIKQDVNYEQFESEIKHFAQREDHGDSCFVFILSHGDDLGNGHWGIATRDGKKIDMEEVISNFSNQRAKSLVNKPKVIVVNACRGHTSDKGVAHQLPLASSIPSKRPRVHNDGNNESPDVLLRTYDDMMYVKSTAFGFASHREENRGSWLIMALCHVFAKESCELDVEKMFKNVDKKIKTWRGLENQRQTIECSTRGLNKTLFLYPGI